MSAGPGATASGPGAVLGLRGEIAALLRLAWPLTASAILTNLLPVVGMIVIARHDSLALAGASIGQAMMLLPNALAGSGGGAIGPIVGQAYGRGDWARISEGIKKALVAIPLAITPIALLVCVGSLALERFGIEPSVAGQARLYLFTALPGILLQPITVIMYAALMATGATRAMLRVTVLGDVVSIGVLLATNELIHSERLLRVVHLDQLGLSRFTLAPVGIAISVSGVALIVAARRAFLREREKGLAAPREPSGSSDSHRRAGGVDRGAPSKDEDAPPFATAPITTSMIYQMAVPTALAILGEIGAGILLTFLSGRFDPAQTAAFRILHILPDAFEGAMMGIGVAAGMRVAWAIGAEVDAKARVRSAVVFVVGTGGLLALLCTVAPASFLPRLISADESVAAAATPMVWTLGVMVIVIGLVHTLAACLRGAGDFVGSAGPLIFGVWVVGVPLAYVLAFHFGLHVRGLWLGTLGGLAVALCILVVRVLTVFSRPLRRL